MIITSFSPQTALFCPVLVHISHCLITHHTISSDGDIFVQYKTLCEVNIVRFVLFKITFQFLVASFSYVFFICTDDEKPTPTPASISTVSFTGPPAKPAAHAVFLEKLQELNTSKYHYLSFF